MRGNEFLDRLELIDPAFIEAADEPPRRKRAAWLQFGAAAACLCVAAAAALTFYGTGRPSPGPGGIAPEPSPSQDVSPTVSDSLTVSVQLNTLHIDMDDVHVADLPQPVVGARLWYDPALYDTGVHWDGAAVRDYYGRSLAPTYVPEGLVPLNEGQDASVIIRKEDGAVVWDTVYLNYNQPYGTYEDGSPRYTDEHFLWHGFTLAASRVGLFSCCLYSYNETRPTDIAGVPVTIGHCAVPYYGPYESDTGPDVDTPSWYFDLYVAEFTLDGIQFQITAQYMSLEDVVKVAASIICPDREITLTQ